MWEIIFPVLTVEVCVTSPGGPNTERLLFFLARLGDLVSAEGRHSPVVVLAPVSYGSALNRQPRQPWRAPHIAELHTLAQAMGGFVFFLCLF